MKLKKLLGYLGGILLLFYSSSAKPQNNSSKKSNPASETSLFERALDYVLKHEGGYVNDPDDTGGETKYGISKRAHPDINIQKLTKDRAREIYRIKYWNPHKYERIKKNMLAIKVFDLAVHIGPYWAHTLVQRALRATGHKVPENGKLTKTTIKALNKVNVKALMAALRSESAGYYRSLALSKPSQKKFLRGWLNRAYS